MMLNIVQLASISTLLTLRLKEGNDEAAEDSLTWDTATKNSCRLLTTNHHNNLPLC